MLLDGWIDIDRNLGILETGYGMVGPGSNLGGSAIFRTRPFRP